VPLPLLADIIFLFHCSTQKSRVNHVVEEIVATEMTYVHDLSAVIEGYVMPLQMRTTILPYDNAQLDSLFGNIVQVRDLHRLVFTAG
jgi:hypothetical protein